MEERDLIGELITLTEDLSLDAYKFYNNGNKAAGTRVRITSQQIKSLLTEIRKDIQTKKQGA
jgi:hypothetical protein